MKSNFTRSIITSFIILLTNWPAAAQPGSMRVADSLFFAKNWSKARVVYQNVLKDTSRNSIAWNRLGFCNHSLNNYDAAARYYQRALTLKPPTTVRGILLARLARISASRNEISAAFTGLDSALANGYANLAELDTVADFKKIRHEKRFRELRDKVYKIAFPCMADPHTREFDFWVGKWDVYQSGSKILVGHNTIEIASDGCGLLENWTNLGNQTGKSLNFIDTNNKWKQTWVGAGGSQEFENGEYKENAMRFDFKTTDAKGAPIIGHFMFYNEGPNQVRQFNETSADNGKTWSTAYDFTYVRRK